MTVQKLIEKLQQIEDKTKNVCFMSVDDCFHIYSVEEDIQKVYLKE